MYTLFDSSILCIESCKLTIYMYVEWRQECHTQPSKCSPGQLDVVAATTSIVHVHVLHFKL